jgi:hypothetical protein
VAVSLYGIKELLIIKIKSNVINSQFENNTERSTDEDVFDKTTGSNGIIREINL